jgi:hypothetical protein
VYFLLAAVIGSPAILRVCEDIVNVHDATLQHGAARRRASILMNWVLFRDLFEKFIRVAVAGRNSINVSILSVDETPLGTA